MRFKVVLSVVVVVTLFFFSCDKKNELDNCFSCNSVESYENLKIYKDFKKNFSISYPDNWKTEYYYDSVTSSIYSANTDLKFTKTIIMDATFNTSSVKIDELFSIKINNENTINNLLTVQSKLISFLGNTAYLNISKGKKGKISKTLLNLFIQQKMGFIHVKAEVYGDSLVQNRLCKVVQIINTLKIN